MNKLENLFKNTLGKEQNEQSAKESLSQLRELIESGCKELITNPKVMDDIEKKLRRRTRRF